MAVVSYYIGGYQWFLMVITLVDICGYYINGCQ